MPRSDDSSAPATGRRAAGSDTGHDRGVARIRAAILQGILSPGQWLIEADLASQFSLSRGSVRSALIEMTGEGFVERVPYRGARVRAVDREGAIRVTELRVVVEGLLAAKAAVNATEGEMEELARMRVSMLESVEKGDLGAYSRSNAALHNAIAEAARHEEAFSVVRRLRGLSGVTHQFHLATLPGRAAASIHEHCALIDAIIARDPERAEHLMRSHLLAVVRALSEAPTPLELGPDQVAPPTTTNGRSQPSDAQAKEEEARQG